MSGCRADAAAERCKIQPEGISGGLAAECPRGHEHETGSAKGQRSLLLHTAFSHHVVFFFFFKSAFDSV